MRRGSGWRARREYEDRNLGTYEKTVCAFDEEGEEQEYKIEVEGLQWSPGEDPSMECPGHPSDVWWEKVRVTMEDGSVVVYDEEPIGGYPEHIRLACSEAEDYAYERCGSEHRPYYNL